MFFVCRHLRFWAGGGGLIAIHFFPSAINIKKGKITKDEPYHTFVEEMQTSSEDRYASPARPCYTDKIKDKNVFNLPAARVGKRTLISVLPLTRARGAVLLHLFRRQSLPQCSHHAPITNTTVTDRSDM